MNFRNTRRGNVSMNSAVGSLTEKTVLLSSFWHFNRHLFFSLEFQITALPNRCESETVSDQITTTSITVCLYVVRRSRSILVFSASRTCFNFICCYVVEVKAYLCWNRGEERSGRGVSEQTELRIWSTSHLERTSGNGNQIRKSTHFFASSDSKLQLLQTKLLRLRCD